MGRILGVGCATCFAPEREFQGPCMRPYVFNSKLLVARVAGSCCQVHSWILEDLDAGSDITYLLKPPSSGEAAWRSDVPLLCANASGRVYALTPG